jgi:hypothetical protein
MLAARSRPFAITERVPNYTSRDREAHPRVRGALTAEPRA